MQIVIEIVDDDYNRINSYPDGKTFYPITARLYKAVKDGTPLPKGHGKIGDIDRLQEVFRRNVIGADAYKQLFDDAPTIIEADKENK